MSKSTWEIWLDDPYGNRLKLLDQVISARAVRVANNVGSVALVLPSVYDDLWRLDGVIEIWRKPEGGALKMFNAYFNRAPRYYDANGLDLTAWAGPDGVHLLKRRVVAYAAESAQAQMTDQADDMMKEIVRDNLTTDCVDTDRNWTANGLTVAGNVALGPSLTLGFARRNVLDVLRDLADASRQAGTYLYFDMVPTVGSGGTIGFDFRTYTGQPGKDRTGADQLVFGKEWGNLNGASLEYNFSDEITVCYAGGQGTGADRTVEEVEDTTRSGASPWGRIEGFTNASGLSSSSDAYVAAGQAALMAGRPKLRFTGTLVETDNCRFGVHWNWGDKVIVSYRKRQYSAVITAVDISISKDGKEQIAGTFEVVG